jgi:hypothetical protein
MNRFITWSGIGVLCASILVPPTARGDMEVSASVQIHANADFNAPLAAHGTWVDVSSYGHCWRPAGVGYGWHPYCSGQWVWTDCGWYWDSNEPWAWACYHYGYWVYDPELGWVWVPDVDWGPAWVSWRCGGGFIGWAPMAPPRFWFFAQVAPPEQFAFTATAHFGDPIRPGVVRINDPVIIKAATETFNVTREKRSVGGSDRRMVINNGPGVEMVEKATGRSVRAMSIQKASLRAHPPETLAKHSATRELPQKADATSRALVESPHDVSRDLRVPPRNAEKGEPRERPPSGRPLAQGHGGENKPGHGP